MTSLDLGTGRISTADLTQLLARIPYIRHARLDRCAVHAGTREELPGDASGAVGADADGEFARLGRACAMAGSKRAREKEKALRAAREALALEENAGEDGMDGGAPVVAQRPRARAGRKGLATATISLRGANDVGALAEPAVMTAPGVVTHGQNLATYSGPDEVMLGVRNMTLGARTNTTTAKVRMATVPPLLRTLCITLRNMPPSVHINANDESTSTGMQQSESESTSDDSIAALLAQHALYRAEFSRGWSEGVVTLRAGWARLRTSERAGLARVAVFRDSLGLQHPHHSTSNINSPPSVSPSSPTSVEEVTPNNESESSQYDAESLVFLDEAGWGVLDGDVNSLESGWPPPVLCFAGEETPLGSGLHTPGCGHEATSGDWDD